MALPGIFQKSIILDWIILIAEGLTVLLVSLLGEPYVRGFSCSDSSIRLPMKDDTVSTLVLALAFVIGGLILIAVVEILLAQNSFAPSTISFKGKAINIWMVHLYRSIVGFLCGAGICQIITDVAKYHVGALRPYFFEVCLPRYSENTDLIDCSQVSDPYRYFNPYEYYCSTVHPADEIKEARLSFPSGHASLSFYCATYLVVHLQSRLSRDDDRKDTAPSKHVANFLLRPLLQGLLIIAAWYTTVSRLMDFKHHFRDVIMGAIIGIIVAVLILRGIRPLRKAGIFQPNEETPLRHVQTSSVVNTNQQEINTVAVDITRFENLNNNSGTLRA